MTRRGRVHVGVAYGGAALATLALGGAGAAFAFDGWQGSFGYALGLVQDAPIEVALAVVISASLAALLGFRLADSTWGPPSRFLAAIPQDLARGFAVAATWFVAEAVVLPVVLALSAGAAEPGVIVFGSVYSAVLFLIIGSFTVLPIALILFGATGWWLGRSGTVTETPGLDPDTPL